MEIQELPIGSIIPYAGNPRQNEAAIDKVAASIEEFGFRQPIVVDEQMVIIAGHTRLAAAKFLGLDRVPVHIAKGLSPAKVRAYRLADNRTNEDATWDEEKLRAELAALREEDFDLSLTGFSDDELAGYLAKAVGATDPDDAPPLPVNPVSKLGDLWVLGHHRLLCGDSTKAEHVAGLLGQVKPHLMVSDPPYGVEYDPSWRNAAGVSHSARTGKVRNDDRADWREAWALFPGDVAYVWHGALHAMTVADSLIAAGFAIRAQIVWAKDRLVLSRGDYHWQHEPCWYAVREKANGHWSGDRKQTTVWNIASHNQDAETVHCTQKPVECMRRPMFNNSSPGHAVYDPFLGSGTTLIAAETTGRHCYAIELEPAYVDVTVERWQNFSGKEAILDGDGRSFAAIKAERLAIKEAA